MSNKSGFDYSEFGDVFRLSQDDTLVQGKQQQLYLDNGALYRFGQTRIFEINTSGDLQFELEGTEGRNMRMFTFSQTSLANQFFLQLFEVSKRDVSTSEDSTNIEEIPATKLNRTVDQPDFPALLYKLKEDSAAEHDLGGIPSETNGTAYTIRPIYSEGYMLQTSGSSPKFFDVGKKEQRASVVHLDLENHNYLFRIKLIDSSARKFVVGVLLGVSDFV